MTEVVAARRPPRRSKLNHDEVREILDAYRAGKSVRAVAEQTGRGYGSVHHHITEAGIMRARGPRHARQDDAATVTTEQD